MAPVTAVAPPPGARDGQLLRGGSLAVRLANFVKLPHTVFAMPFALVGVVLEVKTLALRLLLCKEVASCASSEYDSRQLLPHLG